MKHSGNFESCGTWSYGNVPNDLDDIEVVAEYLATHFGYVVDLIVGHSRGAVVGMAWLCTYGSKHAKHVRGYVSASARYRMFVSDVWPTVAILLNVSYTESSRFVHLFHKRRISLVICIDRGHSGPATRYRQAGIL